MSDFIIREARCLDAAGIARVHVDTWRTAYRGLISEDFLARLSYDEREQRWARTLCDGLTSELVYVAVDQSEDVFGFVSGGPERTGDPVYLGEVYALYVHPAYQRGGLGRRLFLRMAERLHQSGMHSLVVRVLADNPARAFYEALGGKQLRGDTITIDGTEFDEVVYGWSDVMSLKRLARSLRR